MTEIYNADNPLKILSLGWGVQSWTLAAMAALGEIPMPDYAVHADTTHLEFEMFIHNSGLPLEEAVRIPEDYGAKQMEMDIPCDSGHCFV